MERHLNGGGGSWNPITIVSDAVSSVGDFFADIDPGPAIGQAGEEIDTFVNREVPGGWVTVGAVTAAAAAPFIAPSLTQGAGAGAFTGATETGLATLAGEGALADTVGTTLLAGGNPTGGGLLGYLGLGAEGAVPFTPAPGLDPNLFNITGAFPSGSVAVYPGDEQYIAQDLMEQARATNVAPGSPTSWDTGVNKGIGVSEATRGARTLANMLQGGQQMGMTQPNLNMPQFEQFGGLYRGNVAPFLVDKTPQTAALPETKNFLEELGELGKPTDLASLLRNA